LLPLAQMAQARTHPHEFTLSHDCAVSTSQDQNAANSGKKAGRYRAGAELGAPHFLICRHLHVVDLGNRAKLRSVGVGTQTFSRDPEDSALAGLGLFHQRRGTREKLPMRRAPLRTVELVVWGKSSR